MKVVVALALFVALAVGLTEQEYQKAFTDWMLTYRKSYGHDEFQARYRIFRENLDFINAHNAAGHSFTVAMNEFGDLTSEEFGRMYLGTQATIVPEEYEPTNNPELPASWDWRDKHAVTPVKNQGNCGSCWSFSTTGSTEGCHAIKTKQLIGLSEQNLMDCSWAQGNQGYSKPKNVTHLSSTDATVV